MASHNFSGTPTGNGNNNGGGGGLPGGTSTGMPTLPSSNFDPLDLLIPYNQKFQTAGTILFRDQVIQQTLAVLIGKNKPNALLVGMAGVGKTKIVEDIAYRIANNDPLIPDKLKNTNIYELPLSNIVSGSSYVGQVEEKIKAVIEFIENPKNKAILFIDEIHQLCGGQSSSTYKTIAQILKPAMARGTMRIIGATTTEEANDLTADPAFNRRFSKIIVDELSKTQTIEVLKQAATGFFTHYSNKITLQDGIYETVVNMAEDYKPAGSHRPDNALTLLDRTIGDAVVNQKIQLINAANDPAILAALKAIPNIIITEKQVKATAVAIATGNNKPETLDVSKLENALAYIKGQDSILETLIKCLREFELNLFPKTTPMTMLFIGPSGVGKTEVTKIIAKELTGTMPIILNMTEYNSPASINRIIGAPAGYVGYSDHTELPFDALLSNPYQIILLDEFEKCDNAVKTLFMQAFDEGYIKTSKGAVIDFSKSIIIATTNAGHNKPKKSLGFCNTETVTDTSIEDLSKWFDTALLNRFNKRITFHAIDKETYRTIMAERYETEVHRIKAGRRRINLPDNMPDDDLTTLVEKTYVPDFGARPIAVAVKEYIMEQVI